MFARQAIARQMRFASTAFAATIIVALAQTPALAQGEPGSVPGFEPATIAKAPAIAARPLAPATLAMRAAELAGRYAILRDGGKDTGCMLTLDDKARGVRGSKAQLAPACRDQGLVIFDPAGWSLDKGRLTLSARKGHQTHFDQQADGMWLKDTKEGRGLALKKL